MATVRNVDRDSLAMIDADPNDLVYGLYGPDDFIVLMVGRVSIRFTDEQSKAAIHVLVDTRARRDNAAAEADPQEKTPAAATDEPSIACDHDPDKIAEAAERGIEI